MKYTRKRKKLWESKMLNQIWYETPPSFFYMKRFNKKTRKAIKGVKNV